MADPRIDRVGAAYRALPAENPPASLDAAIQAAARRATGSRPGGVRRWQVPVSIAAVLALAVGVSLHVEREQPPLVADGTPVQPASEYPVPASAPALEPEAPKVPVREAPPALVAPSAQAQVRRDALQPLEQRQNAAPREERALAKEFAAPMPEKKSLAPRQVPMPDSAPALPPAMQPAPALAPVPAAPPAAIVPGLPEAAVAPRPAMAPPPMPAAVSGAVDRAAPATAAAPAPARSERSAGASLPGAVAPQSTPRAKAESAAARDTITQEKSLGEAPLSPEQGLARIAELRLAGRHEEADRALAEFRRAHPDYRLSEAWRRKVERP